MALAPARLNGFALHEQCGLCLTRVPSHVSLAGEDAVREEELLEKKHSPAPANY